jgi:hypothetical protein
LAQALKLDGLALDIETLTFRKRGQLIANFIQVQFFDVATLATDEQLEAMGMLRARAGHVGILRLDTVH